VIKPWFKPDWFVVDRATAEPLFGVPGIAMDRNGRDYAVHRSHLALLDNSEASRALGTHAQPDWVWKERDKHTEPLGFKLKTVQHQAVDFIRARRGTLLGDEMRVGKSLASLYSHEPQMGKLVVVGPLMVREVWLGWMRRLWPDTPIGVMVGRKFEPEQARQPIVFGHYDIIRYWQSGDPIGTLILDEAHWLTSKSKTLSHRANAAIMLASVSERVVAATGTPIWNLPVGLWAILAMIAPGAFGGFHDFCMRYAAPEATAYGTKYTGISNGDELSQRLTEVMIRRKWKDVQKDLPPITRNVITVDLSLADRRKLDLRAESLRTSAKTNTAAELARYREALSSIKAEFAVKQAEAFMREGLPVVLWCWHRDTADAIAKLVVEKNFGCYVLHGDVAVQKREKLIEQWRAEPAAALVVTMSVAQVGINLSHSHKPIFAEIDYTPAMISQAEMRTFDPSKAMNVTYVVADHFADRKIAQALMRKFEASEPVALGTGEGAIASIDKAFRGEELEPDMDRLMADLLGG